MRIKPYLSYSQYKAYRSGQYKRIYIDGFKIDNPGIRLGKKFAEFMESKEEKSDIKFFSLAKNIIPKPLEREKKILVDWEGIPIYSILDGYDEDPIIHEYKTGKTAWTQAKVDKDEQLTFYALAVWLLTGNLPKKIWLYWLPRDDSGLTGGLHVFETTRSLKDFIKLYPKVKDAWIGIEELINNLI